jgi:hypothetical protein
MEAGDRRETGGGSPETDGTFPVSLTESVKTFPLSPVVPPSFPVIQLTG